LQIPNQKKSIDKSFIEIIFIYQEKNMDEMLRRWIFHQWNKVILDPKIKLAHLQKIYNCEIKKVKYDEKVIIFQLYNSGVKMENNWDRIMNQTVT
jgi:hypothetical protein